jgi:hypothetical protein
MPGIGAAMVLLQRITDADHPRFDRFDRRHV